MTSVPGKPIPFRKGKRTTGAPSVRPQARIIRAGELVVAGETVISILKRRAHRPAA